MTIAANFKKYAQALALQLPLPFGRLRMLRQSRPTTRAGRAARAARKAIRAAAIKVRVMYPVPKTQAPLAKRRNNKEDLRPLFWWAWTGDWARESKRMPKMVYDWHYAESELALF